MVVVRSLPGRAFTVKAPGSGVALVPTVDGLITNLSNSRVNRSPPRLRSASVCVDTWYDLSNLIETRESKLDLLACVVANADRVVDPIGCHFEREGAILRLLIETSRVTVVPAEQASGAVSRDFRAVLEHLG